MLLLLALLALQASPAAQRSDTTAADSATAGAREAAARDSAFADVPARVLFNRAREVRLQQDAALRSYDVKVAQRLSVGMSLRRLGRERLLARYESAYRLRWGRDVGAWVDVTAKRVAVPMLTRGATVPDGSAMGMVTVPYYPGRDRLWPYEYMGRPDEWDADQSELVHPLDPDGERHYRYSSGDAMTMTLPGGIPVRLRELRVEARRPDWRLIVGSFWFDVADASLVRAAYRPSVPFDIARAADEEGDDDFPRWLKPMSVTVTAITVEYGLHEGRWWLPRAQGFEGEAQVSFMRVPVSYEESFRYQSVNAAAGDALPAIPMAGARVLRPDDDFDLDIEVDTDRKKFRVAVGGDRERRSRDCRDQRDTLVYAARRFRGVMPVALRLPCDTLALMSSADLPPSIYDSGEQLFDRRGRDDLVDMLGLGLQAGWDPRPRAYRYGPELLRYNRVEALSIGAAAEQTLGRGYAADGILRVGLADLEPNAELHLARADGRRTLRVGVYRRLAVVNDWGQPLGFGASLNALLFGRDEGFYYRSWGAELTGTHDRGARVAWRAFVERHGDAPRETNASLAYAVNKVRFDENIDATNGWVVGASSRFTSTAGLDPHGWRLLTDLRAEGGVGDFDYARAAADATVSHGLGEHLDGAVTASAGATAGQTPVQRLWYLGGSHTVRGQDPASAVGDAFWMARAEVAGSFVAARPVIFYDVGWAGSRREWRRPGRPLSGAGVGASIMDGLVRVDVAKAVRPRGGVRLDMYVEARF